MKPPIVFAAIAFLFNGLVVMAGTSQGDGFARGGIAFTVLPAVNVILALVGLALTGKVRHHLRGASIAPYLTTVFFLPVVTGLCAAKILLPRLWQ